MQHYSVKLSILASRYCAISYLRESVPYTIQGIKQECSGYTLGVGLTGWGVNRALGVGVTPWLLSRTPVNESRGVIITPHFLQ